MKKLPSLLVVTDRGHFHAYEGHDDGSLTPLDNMDMDEGLKKLSEQVTDKAGGFPAAESGGHGNSSAERLPLVAELEMRTFRKISQRIQELLRGHHYDTWGFIAPAEINGAILDGLEARLRDKLTANLKLNLTHQTPKEIKKRLLEN